MVTSYYKLENICRPGVLANDAKCRDCREHGLFRVRRHVALVVPVPSAGIPQSSYYYFCPEHGKENVVISHDVFCSFWSQTLDELGYKDTYELEQRQNINGSKGVLEYALTYGRFTELGCNRVFTDILGGLKPTDIFLDIGSGIANVVCYVSLTTGCQSRGVEVNAGRFKVSQTISSRLYETYPLKASVFRLLSFCCPSELNLTNFVCCSFSYQTKYVKKGNIRLLQQDFRELVNSNSNYITEATVVFANQANEIWGSRTGLNPGDETPQLLFKMESQLHCIPAS